MSAPDQQIENGNNAGRYWRLFINEMKTKVSEDPIDRDLEQSIEGQTLRRLQLGFAALCCLGGLVLAGGDDTESLPYVAVFFAMFGYFFVDRMALFALPPFAAYIAMAVVAVYCISGFGDLDAPGNRQMISVAQLLVYVQSILMLQRKTVRIFEQLGVFCLLQLVVAAVFNNAISFGLLMIPICLLAACMLALLSSLTAIRVEDSHAQRFAAKTRISERALREQFAISSTESTRSVSAAAARMPRTAVFTVVPAVALVGIVFFYALPRTTDASRASSRGQALIGFSDHVRLDQIGRMLESAKIAMRVRLTNRLTSQPYLVRNGFYLRGQVLERYDQAGGRGRAAAIWYSIPMDPRLLRNRLPSEYFPDRDTDNNFFDTVDVNIMCESSRTSSLFSIAPCYHRESSRSILHSADRFTILRREQDAWVYPRIQYEFATHAFRRGVQTDVLATQSTRVAASSTRDPSTLAVRGIGMLTRDTSANKGSYVGKLLEFDRSRMPTVAEVADRVVNEMPPESRTPKRIADRLTSLFADSGKFRYTLNLNRAQQPGQDPIEQFVSIDREGHCQYFASALAMMLRSQGIPSRVVVGYRTNEYNELGQYYTVRQNHAHAWVEALIDRDDLRRRVYGQEESDRYWLRLDPTPGIASSTSESGVGVAQMLDLAQNIWDDYVVDMDGTRQKNTLVSPSSTSSIGAAYGRFFSWFEMRISAIRAGQLGGGALASKATFSWRAALVAFAACVVFLAFFRFPWLQGIAAGRRNAKSVNAAAPTLAFYAETLRQLARIGIHRPASATPAELVDHATNVPKYRGAPRLSRPLSVLTTAFYRERYGPGIERNPAGIESKEQIADALEELRNQVDEILRAAENEGSIESQKHNPD